MTNENLIYPDGTPNSTTVRSFYFPNGSVTAPQMPWHPSLPIAQRATHQTQANRAQHGQFLPSITHTSSPESRSCPLLHTSVASVHDHPLQAFPNRVQASGPIYLDGLPSVSHSRDLSLAEGESRVTTLDSYVTTNRLTLATSETSLAPTISTKRNAPTSRLRLAPPLKKGVLKRKSQCKSSRVPISSVGSIQDMAIPFAPSPVGSTRISGPVLKRVGQSDPSIHGTAHRPPTAPFSRSLDNQNVSTSTGITIPHEKSPHEARMTPMASIAAPLLPTTRALSQLLEVAINIQTMMIRSHEESKVLMAHQATLLTEIRDSLAYISTKAERATDNERKDSNNYGSSTTELEIVQLADIASSYVKLHTFLAMNPDNSSLSLYDATADPKSVSVRNGALFALGSTTEDDLLYFFTRQASGKNVKPKNRLSVLAEISRGQTKSHSHMVAHIVVAFYKHCPRDTLFYSDPDADTPEMKTFAASVFSTNAHQNSPMYFSSWLHAARVARSRACTGARRALQDILDKRPLAKLPAVWSNTNENDASDTITMSVCGFAFVVMKVCFDIRRKIGHDRQGHEMNGSQQGAWAAEALRIDDALRVQQGDDAFTGRLQIGYIVFPRTLTDASRCALIAMCKS